MLGVAGGLCSVLFVKLLLAMRKGFMTLPKSSAWLQPVAGGLAVGVIGWFVPEILGVGYDLIDRVLLGNTSLKVLVVMVILKIVATATCYSSGNAGGIFSDRVCSSVQWSAAL